MPMVSVTEYLYHSWDQGMAGKSWNAHVSGTDGLSLLGSGGQCMCQISTPNNIVQGCAC